MFTIMRKLLQEMNYTSRNSMKKIVILGLFAVIGLASAGVSAQTEFTTWGNLTGIRIDNQLMEFNTSLALENKYGNIWATRKEGQNTDFKRTEADKRFTYGMGDNISWSQVITSQKEGQAQLAVSFSSKVDTVINAAYFRVSLPTEFYDSETDFQVKTPDNFKYKDLGLAAEEALYKGIATGVVVTSSTRKLEITFEKPTELLIKAKDSANPDFQLNFVLASGRIAADETFANNFSITASGEIDKSPVAIKVFPNQEGEPFDGIGGNFRLQNPKMDPQVIDYSLKNLDVNWSRVELPWRQWQPDENKDPIAEAKNGNIDPKVKASLEMAQRLDKMGIPVILAAWFAPDWAIVGERVRGVNLDGSRGNALDQTKKEAIYKSLTSYLKYLKEEYGVEAKMFSFNESDLGIDVRQTPEEHNMLIKELGKYWESNGFDTKFLLGDTADANGWEFTTLASVDPETQPYIGGVSFHSWRGWTDENMMKWRDIANRVHKPLFIGEGSIDAGAWRYPQIFEEPTYALDEIDVYVKILNQARPLTILQWQLTSDYSPLSGGGIFGNTKDKLYPTQRFFNLKQLGETPDDLKYIPVTSGQKGIRVAAMGNHENGKYAIHIVNMGAIRMVNLSGLPQTLSSLTMYVTNKNKSFEKVETINLKDGSASFALEGASFISLMNQ